MKRQAISTLALLAAAALCAPAASAACHWEWLCNGEGTCKQMPVCDTLYEDPPPRPDMSIPTPPIRMRPHALPKTMGDNISCEHVMRQTKAGNWQWDEACFCSDPGKSKDPDAPMAHIVRCTPPWEK